MTFGAVPVSLYVHLPWCVRKCPYCDFNSHASPGRDFPEAAYVAALKDELRFEAARHDGRELISVFFGGGTPSLFSGNGIGEILEAVGDEFPLSDALEVTLEANPGTIEHGRFADYRAAGVNRISLGAQSFDDERLRALGRIHAAQDTFGAVDELRRAGFDNFNIDLMYALPNQSVQAAVDDVEQAIALGPTHLSHYQLTLEPGTGFAKRPPPLPDEDASFEMQLECQQRLDAAGFGQYEVSAYARPGRSCRHNENYWRYGDYVGIGAGAHGKRTDLATQSISRTERLRHPARYLEALTPSARLASEREVPPRERIFEFGLNAWRLRAGFAAAEFEARTGMPADVLAPGLERATSRGLVESRADGGWRPTELGRRFLNDLQALFLPETA